MRCDTRTYLVVILTCLCLACSRKPDPPAAPPTNSPSTVENTPLPESEPTDAADSSNEPQIETQLPFPTEILDPPWLDTRREAQLATRDQFQVDTDFAFEDRLESSQITFLHEIVDDAGRDYKGVHYDHGNGVTVADVDGNGHPDIYFVTQVGANQLWMNEGDGTFSQSTSSPDLALADRIGVTASFADVDNDGDADLYVTSVREGNNLLVNDGQGNFSDETEASGLDYRGHSSGAIFFDYDKDGLLDLYLCNVGVYTTAERGRHDYWIGFKDAFAGHLKEERNESSRLYRNLGDRKFQDVTEEVGLIDDSWNGDAVATDVNQDGWPDLYVLDMQGHDEYFENVEGKSFVKRSREVFPKTPWGAMGVGVFDFDNDGDMDILVTDMHSDMAKDIMVNPRSEASLHTFFEEEKEKARQQVSEEILRSGGMSIFGNALYRNNGDGSFEEVSDALGVENYWPWGLSVADLNADGFDDVFIASSMNYPYRYAINSVLLNNRGQKFLDAEFILGVEPRQDVRTAKEWFTLDCSGADKDHKHCEGLEGKVVVWGALGSRSSVVFDLDADGDLDIVTNEFHDYPLVLVSNLSDQRNVRFLPVSLTGTKSNRDGLGAAVTIHVGERKLTKVLDGKSGYLSQSSLPLYFGLDDAAQADRIEVRWPSGVEQTVEGPFPSGKPVTIVEE